MSRKKRPPKITKNPLFDLEDDPGKVFEEFLANEGEIPPKDEDKPEDSARNLSSPPKKREKQQYSIDLHGKTRREVRDVLEAVVKRLKAQGSGPFSLRVITGKGRHSGDQGPVIADVAYDFLKNNYGPSIKSMDQPPSATMIGGVPWRGHFDVTFFFP